MRDDRESRQLVRTVVAGVLVGAALLLLILLVDMLWAPAWLEYSPAVGWALPLLCLLVILGVSWALLAQAGGTDEPDDGSLYIPCIACGRAIFSDWRLCPYCGARVSGDTQVEGDTADAAVTDQVPNG
jgi:hypothetical protein